MSANWRRQRLFIRAKILRNLKKIHSLPWVIYKGNTTEVSHETNDLNKIEHHNHHHQSLHSSPQPWPANSKVRVINSFVFSRQFPSWPRRGITLVLTEDAVQRKGFHDPSNEVYLSDVAVRLHQSQVCVCDVILCAGWCCCENLNLWVIPITNTTGKNQTNRCKSLWTLFHLQEAVISWLCETLSCAVSNAGPQKA